MTIEKSMVTLGYRALLGREPESEKVLEDMSRDSVSDIFFLRQLCNSPEFLYKAHHEIIKKYYSSNPLHIDVDVSIEEMGKLLERVRTCWQSLGAADPYWSVLTNDAFRNSNITEEVKREFFSRLLKYSLRQRSS